MFPCESPRQFSISMCPPKKNKTTTGCAFTLQYDETGNVKKQEEELSMTEHLFREANRRLCKMPSNNKNPGEMTVVQGLFGAAKK